MAASHGIPLSSVPRLHLGVLVLVSNHSRHIQDLRLNRVVELSLKTESRSDTLRKPAACHTHDEGRHSSCCSATSLSIYKHVPRLSFSCLSFLQPSEWPKHHDALFSCTILPSSWFPHGPEQAATWVFLSRLKAQRREAAKLQG